MHPTESTRPRGRADLAIVAAALVGVAILAAVVQTDNVITRADADVVHAIAGWRSPFGVDVANAFTQLGTFVVLLPVTVAFGVVARLRLPQLRQPFTPLIALLLVSVINPLLKLLVDRSRPPGDVAAMTLTSNGFPSGHSAQSMAAWLSIGLVLAQARPSQRRWIVGAGVGIAVVVGCTRVVLGVHSPTDVLGGWALGAACALLVRRVATAWPARSSRRGTRSRSTATRPSPG